MKAAFDHMRWENDAQTIATFFFRPASRYRYEAGQYAVISVPHTRPDARGIERTMTLSSSPNDDLLSMTMRIFRRRSSTFKSALLALQPGDEVTIYDSMGDLVLPLDASVPLVFIAGGVGIASYVGIMKWLLQQGERRSVTLHYAVAQTEDIVIQKPFDKYAAFSHLTKTIYCSGYTPDFNSAHAFTVRVLQRRMTAADIVPTLQPEALIYISGTEKMVEDILHQLEAAGVQRRRVVFDYFDGYSSEL
ncbi:MAG TPA: FAD-dependent oxidoreductase [Candidatus Saccharimonadales bacterium]|jgi:ferredoxin-NADP reductase